MSTGTMYTCIRASAYALIATLLLSGCSGGSKSDLENFVEKELSKPPPGITPLPDFPPYQLYTYQSVDDVDPFKPLFEESEDVEPTAVSTTALQPDHDRNKEELESYPLDALRMMGTLEQKEERWGIIRSPDGVIHRVQTTNYMGKNHGKIIDISDEEISLTEIISDGQGGWVVRQAAIAMSEPQ